ncbi:Protein maternal effect lethal 26 [Halotydeus destructor]|nr:Protein maternal effect lethal 26 [Halotydeus destructor]
MLFNGDVHGSNIVIEQDGRCATRKNEFSFYNGLLFSSEPLKLNKSFSLSVKSADIKWRGSFAIGLVDTDPGLLSKEKCLPSFLQQVGSNDRRWSYKMSNAFWGDCRLNIVLSSGHDLVLTVNDDMPRVYLSSSSSSSCWLVIDLFGRSTQVSIVEFDDETSRIPSDIVHLGPRVVEMYKAQCKEASVPSSVARIALIGPYGSGKTTLKRTLLGMTCDEVPEQSAIDDATMCHSNKLGEWTLDNLNSTMSEGQDFANVLAFNLIREEEFRRDFGETKSGCAPRGLVKNALGISKRNIGYVPDDITAFTEDLPEQLASDVRILLSDETKNWFSEFAYGLHVRNQMRCKYLLYDFSGDILCLLPHQVLLSSQMLYVLVVDISEHLDSPLAGSVDNVVPIEVQKNDMTTINLIHNWLSTLDSIVGKHHYVGDDSEDEEQQFSSYPKVLIVGTHRNSVHLEPITRDQIINDAIDKIELSIKDKPYRHLVHSKIFAIDCCQMSHDEPTLLSQLRVCIDQVVQEQHLADYEIPLSWISFDFIIKKLLSRNIYFVDIGQLFEVTRSHFDVYSNYEMFRSMIHFQEVRGKVLTLGQNLLNMPQFSSDEIVILDPVWFAKQINLLCNSVRTFDETDNLSCKQGMLKDEILAQLWSQCVENKDILLECLEKLDIVCELRPYMGSDEAPDVAASAMVSKLYFVPWIASSLPDNYGYAANMVGDCLRIAVDFKGSIPCGFFSRLVVRLGSWSWGQGWGRRPEVAQGESRLAVDFDHDVELRVSLAQSRIYVVIMKIYESEHEDHDDSLGPNSNVCVKVRHLLETQVEYVRKTYYVRSCPVMVVRCPCNLTCHLHQESGCNAEACEHFLPLDQCLSNKVTQCDYRQVRTAFVQKFFPQAHFGFQTRQNYDAYEDLNSSLAHERQYGDATGLLHAEPSWLRPSAKLLSSHNLNNDWSALARRLGYTEMDIGRFKLEVNPALCLVGDWYDSNGRTKYCIDVLVSCLGLLSRVDVIKVIEDELEPDCSPPPVFISYQWDSQEAVLELRRKLEMAGFPCWMDVGLMGGGDSLYGKIYEGVSRAKVVICCLSPRYAASRTCTREITLADVLQKPILPIILEATPWPPPGPLAIILSSLVYIDLCGVGSHGGTGKASDTESRFRDILDRISRYITGNIDYHISNRQSLFPDIFTNSLAGYMQQNSAMSVSNFPAELSPPRTQSTSVGQDDVHSNYVPLQLGIPLKPITAFGFGSARSTPFIFQSERINVPQALEKCSDLKLSVCEGNEKLCGGQIASTKHEISIEKCSGSPENLKRTNHLKFNMELDEVCEIGNLEDLHIHDGYLVVRVRIKFEGYVHTKEKATVLKLYNSIDNRLCDFEILTNGGSMKVFRSMLCLKWSYFDDMISARYSESLNNTWVIDDFSYQTMKAIVLYVYCDTITLDDKEQVLEILKAAHRYQLDSLVQDCSYYLLLNIHFEDALEVFVVSDLYALVDLKTKCSDLISGALVRMKMKDMPGYGEFSKHPDVLRLTEECFRLASKLFRNESSGSLKRKLP